MDRKLVYDLPTRVFHWIFAGLFVTAFTIGKTIDDDSALFSWHMLAGLTMGFVVILRILWGFIGTRHARFSDFVLGPAEMLRYVRGILAGDKRRWAGHNPASSWAALGMMVLALGLALSGLLMTSGGEKETIEELHELFGNAFLVIVVLHIAGVVLHRLRHGEMIALSMVDGRKEQVADAQAIASGRHAYGVLYLAMVLGFALTLWNNFDPGRGALQLFGTTLQLGEHEGHEHGHEHEEEEHDED